MLPFIRRVCVLLIRPGLGLIAVTSLAALVVLLHMLRSSVALTDHVPSITLAPDSSDAEAQAAPSPNESSVERARDQVSSLVRADDAALVDWSVLSPEAVTDDTELLPTTLEGLDEPSLIAGLDLAAAGWLLPGTQVTDRVRSDIGPAGFAHGASGGGGSSGAAGGGAGPGSASGDASSESTGDSDADVPVTLGSQHGGNHDSHGDQSSNNNGPASEHDGRNGHANDHHGDRNDGGEGSRGSGDGKRYDGRPDAEHDVTAVPEPSTLLLAGVGLLSLTTSRSRRRTGRYIVGRSLLI